jgi:hypothetical protein
LAKNGFVLEGDRETNKSPFGVDLNHGQPLKAFAAIVACHYEDSLIFARLILSDSLKSFLLDHEAFNRHLSSVSSTSRFWLCAELPGKVNGFRNFRMDFAS